MEQASKGGPVDISCACPACGTALGTSRGVVDVLQCPTCQTVSVHGMSLWRYNGRWLCRQLAWHCDLIKLNALYARKPVTEWTIEDAFACAVR